MPADWGGGGGDNGQAGAGGALTWRSRLWFSHSSCRKRRMGRIMSTAVPISLLCTRSLISCPRCKLGPSE